MTNAASGLIIVRRLLDLRGVGMNLKQLASFGFALMIAVSACKKKPNTGEITKEGAQAAVNRWLAGPPSDKLGRIRIFEGEITVISLMVDHYGQKSAGATLLFQNLKYAKWNDIDPQICSGRGHAAFYRDEDGAWFLTHISCHEPRSDDLYIGSDEQTIYVY